MFLFVGYIGFNILLIQTRTVVLAVEKDPYCTPTQNSHTFTALSGQWQTFATPGFSSGVSRAGLDCHYIIKASYYGNRIQLLIHESRMEVRLFTDCDDYMEIRDGSRNDSALIIRWCGYDNPLSITGTTDSLHIRYKTDMYYDSKGVNLSFTEYAIPGCPANWVSFSDQIMCYRLVTPKPNVSWVQAQYHCNYDKSNLLTIDSYEEYQAIYNTFSPSKASPWIGLNDAQDEGNFVNVDHSTNVWPHKCDTLDAQGPCFPLFNDHENKDCLYMDFNRDSGLYKVDDCRSERSFICKKRRDGATVAYPPPEAAVKQGFFGPSSASLSPALIVLIALSFFLILLLIFVSYVKNRLKRKTRVHSLDTGDQRGALINAAGGREPPPPPPKADDANGGEKLTKNIALDDSLANDPKALRQIIAPKSAGAALANGQAAMNGHVANGHLVNLPPIDKFDRPNVCPLDNMSAISLDEFWHKLEAEKYRQYPTSARTFRN